MWATDVYLGLFEGSMAEGPGSTPDALAGIWETIPYGGMLCSTLM